MKTRAAALMTTASFVGVVGLIWLSNQIIEHSAQPGRPTFAIDSRIAAVYTPRSLIAFAKARMPFKDYEELRKAIQEADLSDSWIAAAHIMQLSDGSSQRSYMIMHPGNPDQSHRFPDIRELLAIVSETHSDTTNRVKIGIIDDRRLNDDPLEVLADMEEASRTAVRAGRSHPTDSGNSR